MATVGATVGGNSHLGQTRKYHRKVHHITRGYYVA